MPKEKSPLRRRITPSVPFVLHVEDAEGTFEQVPTCLRLNSMALFEEATGLNLFRDIGKILAKTFRAHSYRTFLGRCAD